MARIARVVAPAIPHHLTQRGNRRQATFCGAEDYQAYLALMAEWCRSYEVEIWAYCLMPNHVHLIAVPKSEEGLRRAIGEAHRRDTRRVNFRQGWRGHLWQGRFASFPLDERYLLAAARYIEQHPVRAGLAATPWEYPWSSAKAHVSGKDDALVRAAPLLDRVGEWADLLGAGTAEEERQQLRRYERTGRPLGSDRCVTAVESKLQRTLRRGKPGPKPRRNSEISMVSPEF